MYNGHKPPTNSSVKCAVLVPVAGAIENSCDVSLRILEGLGYSVFRVCGYSDISRGRSQIATDAIADKFEELLWIDSDVEFHADSVDRLRSHNLPIVGGVYPVKGQRRLACKVLRGTDEIKFGKEGGLLEVEHLAFGFILTKAEVYREIQRKFSLPTCVGGKNGLVPYFQPMVVHKPEDGRHLYLSEGFSFCERARACGFKIMADTTIRLGHIGKKSYSWEEAGTSITRYGTFTYRLDGPVNESSG